VVTLLGQADEAECVGTCRLIWLQARFMLLADCIFLRINRIAMVRCMAQCMWRGSPLDQGLRSSSIIATSAPCSWGRTEWILPVLTRKGWC